MAALIAFAFVTISRERVQAGILRADPDAILADATLRPLALRWGAEVFASHCAACHGAGGAGDSTVGAPNLTDADFLYGQGRATEIEQIVRHGIRSRDPRGFSLASMPAYATVRPDLTEPLPPLTPREIEEVTQYVLAFSGHATDPAPASRGGVLFGAKAGCWDCHSEDARGDSAIGAPDLADGSWLYGDGSHDSIRRSIAYGRAGMSPAFKDLLSAAQIRDVSIFVASLAPPPSAAPPHRGK
ncbi:MAG: c-type cytochrome [Sphingomonas bacterium]|nr:c-type cytochrome [Sphingomonas bacterium]